MTKVCSKCRLDMPRTSFHKDNKTKDGLKCWCVGCMRKARQNYEWRNPEARKHRDLKATYGISFSDYNKMLSNQNFRCAICQRHTSELRKGMVVDHDHVTGKVRSILCCSCNHRLSGFEDKVFSVLAVSYLNRFQGVENV